MNKKRVFVAFAIEDKTSKIFFTGMAKNARVPYEFVDMSVKEPWSSQWKTKCRTKIKGCHGMIVLVSKNLKNADGALWEVQCAKDEGVRVRGIYIDGATSVNKPTELYGTLCETWTWENVKSFIESL